MSNIFFCFNTLDEISGLQKRTQLLIIIEYVSAFLLSARSYFHDSPIYFFDPTKAVYQIKHNYNVAVEI